MSATPDSTLANPEQLIADLRRRLAEREAELAEALEQQTATAEVLQVINASPGDLVPVFDAILEKATRVCEAVFGALLTWDSERFHWVAFRGVPAELVEALQQPVTPVPGNIADRIVRGEMVISTPDLREAEYRGVPVAQAFLRHGARSCVHVALHKEERLLGHITIYREEVRPFTDKEIGLLQNFAAQAVIAIENARLLTETREALEQQTATSEVLQVINSSPGNLGPVFDSILEKATRLCEAPFGVLRTWDGERFYLIAAQGDPKFTEWAWNYGPFAPAHDFSPAGRIVRGEEVVRFADAPGAAALSISPGFGELVEASGMRSGVTVALRKDDILCGTVTVWRREARPFSDKQIALLQNFAAQAVIAMENARLLTETREALEQQTATAEVLQVINSSPGDLAPVFDAMLDKALDLCGAAFGLLIIWDGEQFHRVAFRGVPAELIEAMRQPLKPVLGGFADRLVCGERVIAVTDLLEAGDQPIGPGAQLLVRFGARSYVGVALRKDEALLGAIVIYRREVRPFSDKEIALLENFAAQAVIAMENARLITETREALEQQTATAEVLQVINSSPSDLAPVFDAMLDRALLLCEAGFGSLTTYDGEFFNAVAGRGEDVGEWVPEQGRHIRPEPGTTVSRILKGEDVVHVADITQDEETQSTSRIRRAMIDRGFRTLLTVALRKDRRLLGAINIFRREMRPFSDKQIALLQNFAAQAVIAMENARLITETREALDQQTATAEVLGVINSSPGDLAPVFDAMLEKTLRLCEAAHGNFLTYDGEVFHQAAFRGEPQFAEYRRQQGPLRPAEIGQLARVVQGEGTLHRIDAREDEAYRDDPAFRRMVDGLGIRTSLTVPLRKGDALLGAVRAYRLEVRPFTDKQIALVENFAAQAVVAMENARLITETREALEQQTATAEVLQVINSSPGDLAPVFDAMLEKAVRLCDAETGHLLRYENGVWSREASLGVPEDFDRLFPRGQPINHAPASPPNRMTATRTIIHVADMREDESYLTGAPTEVAGVQAGIRTALFVPLLKEGDVVGCFVMHRMEVRPFGDKQIALLENFAAQAVIAIDNARLLDEIRQRQAELRVTFDNMGDGVAMFDGELRLAAWNLNFQRLLDLPDQLLAERLPYADYIRFFARRGEFGSADIEAELSRRLEGLGQELRLEHTRPDGRIIEVRRNAVPGGGFVVIYSDVTERKRAEEEIRAARNTAERALQELKTTQASLLHAQKMAALGQLTAGIAHEIKNPLNFVNNFAELSGELLQELKETAAPAVAALVGDQRAAVDEVVEMLRGNLDKIAEHGKRADGIVKSMLEHSRGVSGERRVVDFNGLIEEALNLAYHGARAQDASFNITLEREFDRGLAPTELAPQDMTRVFLNLFGNGFYATTKRQRDGAGPEFRPTLKVATRDLGEAVEVRIRDNGTGIAPEIRDKLFQPFVTTKPTGEGTGLGLSIAYDIVTQQHGGTIEVDTRTGEFTEFTIRLPRPQ